MKQGFEVGEIVELNDVWDGEGEAPDDEESGSYGSYSHKITNDQWINYEFDIVEKKENPLDTGRTGREDRFPQERHNSTR